MSIVDRTLGRLGLVRKSAPSWEAGLREALGLGAQTASAIAVSPESAMKCPAVMAATRIRCETLASLSVKVFKRDGDSKQVASDHPLHRLLNKQANGWTSSAEFIAELERDVITHGQAFALANRLSDGRIFELLRLKPSSVSVDYDDATAEPTYKVNLKGGGQREYHYRDILHVKALGGRAVVQDAREAIGLAIALERHAANLMAKGCRPGGVLKTAKTITSDAVVDRLTRQFQQAHSGESAGSVALLEDGLDYQPLTFNSVDLEFSAMRNFQILEISRAFGVMPNLLSDYSSAKYASAESMWAVQLSASLLPRIRFWEGALNRLFTEDEAERYFIEINADSIVRADLEQRYQAYSTAISSRFMSPNEVRARESLPAGPPELDRFENPNTTPGPAPRPRNRNRDNEG
ncbi:MAG: phage portal protein [Xanthobacteraceae bacterium]|nr:phage portal protein [Xanthobacteraceae bacterium]